MPDAPVATPLAGVFPPRLVARLHRQRFEGTLRLHGGGATRVIYFRRGEIASAASNADEDRLPNILIREGRLTGPQVEMARAKQRPGVSLGKTLIELGFLTPTELLQGARRQVRQILAAAFALREGTSQEAPGPLPPEVTVLGLPVRRLIFDALLEVGDRQTVVQEMGSMETVYRPSDDLETALPALRLDPQHEEVARLVDGRATLREISGRVRLDDLTVSKVVLGLEILGLVEQESPTMGAAPLGRRIPVIAEEADASDEPEMKVASQTWAATIAPPAAENGAEPAAVAAEPAPVAAETSAGIAASAAPAFSAAPAPSVPYPPSAPSTAYLPSAPSAPSPSFDPSVSYSESDPEDSSPPDRESMPIEFEEEAETPPIPPGELPAFAAPPNVPTGWSVDPETGEKVHLGPIELTFDGPVVPPQQSGARRGRLALFGAAGMLAVAAVVAFFVVRGNGASEPEGPAPDEIASRAAGTDAAPPGTTLEENAAPEPGAPSAPETSSAPGERAETPGEDAAPGADAEPAPSPTAPPIAAPPPRNDNARPREGTGATVDFGFGQRLLDAGTVDRAAEAFRRAIGPIPAGRFSLQTMIACEAESVRKARAGTRPDTGLFVLPVAVRGRGCFRVMWGVFETREAAAEAARSDLPQYFVSSGVSPAVVSIDRLRSPS